MEPHIIKEKLHDRNLRVVSEVTGISYTALTRWVKGETRRPSYEMIVKLQSYFTKRSAR